MEKNTNEITEIAEIRKFAEILTLTQPYHLFLPDWEVMSFVLSTTINSSFGQFPYFLVSIGNFSAFS